MAAAPELLEALKAILRHSDSELSRCSSKESLFLARERAFDVIAKATWREME
ncbi:MAG: hypothetical protein H7839_04920 [Magnetococcus sp. YQC-5]